MVQISIKLSDLDILIAGLDSDFYFNGNEAEKTRYYDQINELRKKLEKILERENELKKLNSEIRHVLFCMSHNVGFSTDEGLEKIDILNKQIEKLKSGDKK